MLLWEGGAVHKSRASQEFRSRLDTSAGRELLQQCDAAWPHYSEIVRNRKHCILTLSKKLLNDGINQAAILGAGFDALSLELAAHANAAIFDVDMADMTAKSDMILSINPTLCSKIRCITADISNFEAMAKKLSDAGWSNAPSLIIIEGLSYYISKFNLWNMIQNLRSDTKTDVILEYLLPRDQIPYADRHASEGAFGIICKKFNLPPLTRYDSDDIKSGIARLGGTVHYTYDMTRMEKDRTGKNRLCSSSKNNWIEICHASL